MKHGRGIDLVPSDPGQLLYTTFDRLPEWISLGYQCRACGHVGWIDRHALQRKYGTNVYVGSLTARLKCTRCGRRGESGFVVGKLPR